MNFSNYVNYVSAFVSFFGIVALLFGIWGLFYKQPMLMPPDMPYVSPFSGYRVNYIPGERGWMMQVYKRTEKSEELVLQQNVSFRED